MTANHVPDDHPKIVLARIEERQKAAIDRMAEVSAKLDKLASKESVDSLAGRVKAIENTQSWLWRTFVLTAIAAVSSVFAWGKQHGAP